MTKKKPKKPGKKPGKKGGGNIPHTNDPNNMIKELLSAYGQAGFGPAQPSGCADPRTLGGQIAGPGGPHDQGAVLIDATDCVLMDSLDVCIIDRVQGGKSQGEGIFMTLNGRVNKTERNVQVGYIFDVDGAAAIITELLALADRSGPAMLTAIVDRLVALSRDGNTHIAWLRTALDAVEDQL